MLKLLKYEFYRKLKMFIIAASILVFAEGVVLFGIFKGGGWTILSFLTTFFMISGVVLFVFIDSIRTYSSDLNQKEGYSLFLTPTSGYKIIGSKAIMSFLELLVFVTIVFAMMVLNFEVTKFMYKDVVQSILDPMFEALKTVYTIPNLFEIIMIVLVYVFEWFAVIMIAILSMTLRKTILANSKLGWLISLVFFVVLYSTMETITMFVLAPFGFYREIIDLIQTSTQFAPSQFTFNIFKYVGVAACMYPLYLGILFYFSGKLLNQRVDL
ncbi:MAG: hypothetical protein H7X94_10085 [Vallitaleaceae bacterium]|nr:hypothetical protein [Vallitaleaceae bacterium]